MCLVSSLFVIVGGDTRHITENKALKKTHMVLFVCSLSLKLTTTTFTGVFFGTLHL